MTAKLSQSQREHFIRLAETSLNDVCIVHQFTGETQNEYNDVEQEMFTDVENVPCGFRHAAVPYQRELNQPVVFQYDGQLRVKLSQPLTSKDDVTVRGHRYHVDTVWDGITLRMASLKYFGTSENG